MPRARLSRVTDSLSGVLFTGRVVLSRGVCLPPGLRPARFLFRCRAKVAVAERAGAAGVRGEGMRVPEEGARGGGFGRPCRGRMSWRELSVRKNEGEL